MRQTVKFTAFKQELQQYFEGIFELNKMHSLRKILAFVKKSVSFSLTIEKLTAKRFQLMNVLYLVTRTEQFQIRHCFFSVVVVLYMILHKIHNKKMIPH